MKKAHLVIFTMVLFFSTVIFADTPGPLPVKRDTLLLQLIPSLKHNLSVNLAHRQKMVYFIDEITVDKADLLRKGMGSFFLNRALRMTKISINGAEVHVKEYTHLDANNFIPRIRIQAISEINEKCRMLEFFAEDLDVNNLPDTIKIKMKYELALHDTASSIEIGQGKVTLIGDSFWYPRNLHQSENVAINIRTNDLGSAALNDQKLDFIQTGYLKEHKLDFVDGADDPHSITIFCPELE